MLPELYAMNRNWTAMDPLTEDRPVPFVRTGGSSAAC